MEAHLLTLFWYFWWLLTHSSWFFQYLMNHTFDRFKCPFHIGKYTFHMIMMNELLFFYEKYFSCTYTFFWKEIICTCHKYIFSLYLFQYTFISQFFKSGQIYSYGIKRLVFFLSGISWYFHISGIHSKTLQIVVAYSWWLQYLLKDILPFVSRLLLNPNQFFSSG